MLLDCEIIPGEWVECNCCDESGYIEDEYSDDDYKEECLECGGEGGYYLDDEEVYFLNEFFDNFIKLIRQYFLQKNCKEGIEAIDDVQKVIENNYHITEYNISKYDRVIDYIIWLVLNDEDNQELIPEWYKNK